MQVHVEELSPCQKKLTIQLSVEEVNQEYQTVIKDVRTKAAIPGFRKGKASISTIRRRFSKEIKQDVKEKLLERSLKDALVQQNIAPIGTPSVDVQNLSIVENQPVEYQAEVEFIPPLEITDYKGVKVPKPAAAAVSEESVTRALQVLQRQNAIHEPVDDDHQITVDDSVTITYQRTLDGQPLGQPGEHATIWLGGEQILPELRQNLLGKKKGEQVAFSVQTEADAQNPDLAGKTIDFVVDIVTVEKVSLPEIDDEFAKDLEEESLEVLQQKLRESIAQQLEEDAIAATKHKILMTLAETYMFELPPSLLKEQKKKYPNQEEESLKKMLRAGIILSKIQTQEQITVPDEEVETFVEQLAMQRHLPVAAMKSELAKNAGIERIKSDMIEAKTLNFLYEHAEFTEEP